MSWRLKKQIGGNVRYVASVLKTNYIKKVAHKKDTHTKKVHLLYQNFGAQKGHIKRVACKKKTQLKTLVHKKGHIKKVAHKKATTKIH
jgi:hypothetical protein